MQHIRHRLHGLLLLVAGAMSSLPAAAEISFSRQVLPILTENCFQCHGPDEKERKAGLRLDVETEAKTPHKAQKAQKGITAIVPGNPARSELIARVTATDPDEVMPPPKTGRKLRPADIATLRQWIREGAKWGRHWAFEKPERPPVPDVPGVPGVRGLPGRGDAHPIDAFIRARLRSAGLRPSPEADRRTRIRRLSLDLLGLPPAPDEVDAFVNDRRPDADERLVDRLMASPHFGERWGRHWLDLARYADSDGYEKDSPRPNAYLYRDWVIDAIHRDMPFDEFTIWQLAGDLLDTNSVAPALTVGPRIATGFHRQTLINKEGGVDQEEYRCKANVDRTHTTGAVWLGLTVGCAECHSHKYDPISQREFYQLYAFFNNASDADLPIATAAEAAAHDVALKKWKSRLAELEAKVAKLSPPTNTATAAEGPRPGGTAPDAGAARAREELARHRKSEPRLKSPAAMVLVSQPRATHLHVRGDFLQKGEEVRPATPAFLHRLEPRGAEPDRLDLARWLVSPENPLTARVAVNHIWRNLFGRGLVATENDFGLRGERPSHPELLDWLALEFQRLNWSRKGLIRLIVSSATYRQSSAWRADLAEVDPLNTLVARQGRFRVEAEAVRDIALATSGLLNRRVGGPSFKPELPNDLANLNYANGLKWEPAAGDERYRRGLYIHFQRTVPLPMLMAFDAPESTVTCTRRERSNSPLQALTLLNNELFLDCARALGRTLPRTSGDPASQIRAAFESVTSRRPTGAELRRLREFQDTQRRMFGANPAAAREAAGLKDAPASDTLFDAATATALARVLLNLEETITRE